LKRNTRQGYKETRELIKQNKALQRMLSHQWYPSGEGHGDDDDVVVKKGVF